MRPTHGNMTNNTQDQGDDTFDVDRQFFFPKGFVENSHMKIKTLLLFQIKHWWTKSSNVFMFSATRFNHHCGQILRFDCLSSNSSSLKFNPEEDWRNTPSRGPRHCVYVCMSVCAVCVHVCACVRVCVSVVVGEESSVGRWVGVKNSGSLYPALFYRVIKFDQTIEFMSTITVKTTGSHPPWCFRFFWPGLPLRAFGAWFHHKLLLRIAQIGLFLY